MNEESIKILVEEYQSWSDDELIKTYQENDQEHYGEVAFEAMKRIAAERNLTLPSQHEFIPNPRESDTGVKGFKTVLIVFLGIVLVVLYLTVRAAKAADGENAATADCLMVTLVIALLWFNQKRKAKK